MQNDDNIHASSDGSNSSADSKMRVRKQRILFAMLLVLSFVGAIAANQGQVAPGGAPAPASRRFEAATRGPVHFSVSLDRHSVLVGSDGEVKLELVIEADASPTSAVSESVPTDLVVVLDRSGSMQGQPIDFARAAVRQLISELGPTDRFALVSYSSWATLSIPLESATEDARRRWIAAVAGIATQGETNMSSGLDLASSTLLGQRTAGRSARVILISDGHANEGDSSYVGLIARAAAAVRGEYVLSTVGVGGGFDETLMTSLAATGTGNFYYVQRGSELAEVFADEFASARETVARALEVHVDAAPGVSLVEAGGYPIERVGSHFVVRPGALFAGQQRRLWLSLRAPAAAPGRQPLGQVALRYRQLDGTRVNLDIDQIMEVACVEGEEDYYAAFDVEAWERSVIVEDYNALKQQVAQDIQRGDRKHARDRIAEFGQRQKKANAFLKRQAVVRQLEELDTFSNQVEAAFTVSPLLSSQIRKEISMEAYDGRKVGAKR